MESLVGAKSPPLSILRSPQISQKPSSPQQNLSLSSPPRQNLSLSSAFPLELSSSPLAPSPSTDRVCKVNRSTREKELRKKRRHSSPIVPLRNGPSQKSSLETPVKEDSHIKKHTDLGAPLRHLKFSPTEKKGKTSSLVMVDEDERDPALSPTFLDNVTHFIRPKNWKDHKKSKKHQRRLSLDAQSPHVARKTPPKQEKKQGAQGVSDQGERADHRGRRDTAPVSFEDKQEPPPPSSKKGPPKSQSAGRSLAHQCKRYYHKDTQPAAIFDEDYFSPPRSSPDNIPSEFSPILTRPLPSSTSLTNISRSSIPSSNSFTTFPASSSMSATSFSVPPSSGPPPAISPSPPSLQPAVSFSLSSLIPPPISPPPSSIPPPISPPPSSIPPPISPSPPSLQPAVSFSLSSSVPPPISPPPSSIPPPISPPPSWIPPPISPPPSSIPPPISPPFTPPPIIPSPHSFQSPVSPPPFSKSPFPSISISFSHPDSRPARKPTIGPLFPFLHHPNENSLSLSTPRDSEGKSPTDHDSRFSPLKVLRRFSTSDYSEGSLASESEKNPRANLTTRFEEEHVPREGRPFSVSPEPSPHGKDLKSSFSFHFSRNTTAEEHHRKGRRQSETPAVHVFHPDRFPRRNTMPARCLSPSPDNIAGIGSWIPNREKINKIVAQSGITKANDKKEKKPQKKLRKKTVFGVSLEKMYRKRDMEGGVLDGIPLIVEICVRYLFRRGVLVDGVFRVSGEQKKLLDMMSKFETPNTNVNLEESSSADPNTIANLLKEYLRALPEAPIPLSLARRIFALFGNDEPPSLIIPALRDILRDMPILNLILLRFFCEFLSQVAKYSSINRMGPSNLGVVFGPCFFHPVSLDSFCASQASAFLIEFYQLVFVGGIDGEDERPLVWKPEDVDVLRLE